ncbi:hypothetical protein QQS21_000002 [Conoideocrella luteorostrata]|uniref:Zn(2)-C6 fungal-type domain-containing protein n=1 Tax=Conoideocrella luteorostrata TaxID=1105319 RepID=A0AAJ0CZF2_9HYPO|nr:hypothetical protein QQS21_000002 [Conoideocrella luteorostrata]
MDDSTSTSKTNESLRASCDNCARSKVRCGKQQPRCQRCIQRGITCGYSLSQRSRKRTLSTPSGGSSSTGSSCGDQDKRENLPLDNGRGSITPPASSSGKKNTSSTFHDVSHSALFIDLENNFINQGSKSTGCSGSAVPVAFPWVADNLVGAGMAGSDGDLDMDMTDMLSMGGHEGILDNATPFVFGSGTPAGTLFEDHLPQQDSSQIKHCSALLLSTLQQLGLPIASCNGVWAATQSLGTVLKASRSALDSAMFVASCNCAPNANVALLFTSVMLRILLWYDAVLKSNRDDEIGGNGDEASSPTTGYGADAHHPNGSISCGSVSSMDKNLSPGAGKTESIGTRPGLVVSPITIGVYQLDMEDQARMIVHIVLSELAKMSRLLDSFSKKFCRGGSSSSLGNSSGIQLHVALEMFLRNKHSVTVLAANKKLDER